MKFQPKFTPKKEFKSIYQKEFKEPSVQKAKFHLMQTSLTRDKDKLEEYRLINLVNDGVKVIKIIQEHI